MSQIDVITRFAPSPTGELHLGNARTALFNLLLARRLGGQFVLRIEDTDLERSKPQFTRALLADLHWLGIEWDAGPDRGGPHAPYAQSERAAHYDAGFERLQREGHSYPCFCSALELDVSRRTQLAAGRPPRYAGTCRDLPAAEREARIAAGAKPTLRFRVAAGARLDFVDLVHGPQSFLSDDIGDFIVRRADGTAAFFFSNALDDAAMGITHVLRGEDHLTNTPRQLLILRALGARAPSYAHVALLVGADGAPLSKRNGALSLRELREQGYLPAAVVNHLFRLGHSSAANGFLTLAEMAQHFETRHLGRAPARFDGAQLDMWQKEAVQRLDPQAAAAWLATAVAPRFAAADPQLYREFVAAVRANVVLPADAAHWAEVVMGAQIGADAEGAQAIAAAGPEFFRAAAGAVRAHGSDWQALVGAIREATGRKGPALYKPLRYALTGVGHGPELAPLLKLMPPATIHARFERYSH